jgi:hypothetical protein
VVAAPIGRATRDRARECRSRCRVGRAGVPPRGAGRPSALLDVATSAAAGTRAPAPAEAARDPRPDRTCAPSRPRFPPRTRSRFDTSGTGSIVGLRHRVAPVSRRLRAARMRRWFDAVTFAASARSVAAVDSRDPARKRASRCIDANDHDVFAPMRCDGAQSNFGQTLPFVGTWPVNIRQTRYKRCQRRARRHSIEASLSEAQRGDAARRRAEARST